MKFQLTIIIVNWNTRELTAKCIESVLNSVARTDYQIIVVDNGSTDDSAEFLKNSFKTFPNVRFLLLGSNFGFAKANNLAISNVISPAILFLNSDTVVHGDAIKCALEFLQEHDSVGVVGCKLLNGDGSLQRSCSNFPKLLTPVLGRQFVARRLRAIAPKFALRFTSALFDEDHEQVQFPDWIMGAFMLIRGDLAKKIGGFDEQYFMYMEDMDLCYKVKKAGYKTAFLPYGNVTHFGGTSSRTIPHKRIMREIASTFRFFCKSRGTFTARLYIVLEVLSQAFELFLINVFMLKPDKVGGHTISETSFKLRCYLKALFLPSDMLKQWGI